MYESSSTGIKRSGLEPISSHVSSAHVIMHKSKLPSVLDLQLNEQQNVKFGRVSRNDMYGKRWDDCSSDCYRGVFED